MIEWSDWHWTVNVCLSWDEEEEAVLNQVSRFELNSAGVSNCS